MSLNRTAALPPLFLRAAVRAGRTHPTTLPRTLPAVALLLPRRSYTPETGTESSSAQNFPPPGYNHEQARRPSPEQEKQTKASSEAVKKDDASSLKAPESPAAAQNEATSQPKTDAVEQSTLTSLAAEKASSDKEELKKAEKKKEENKKLTIWQKVKKEANHYWDGTKLLGTEIKISTKLLFKKTGGYELSRREDRQLTRTLRDLARLIPFVPFVIIPFAELLLPVALRIFPNLLPSTYEGSNSRIAKATRLRGTRKEVSNFLRSTLKETGLPISMVTAQKEEFTTFFHKIRNTGEVPTASDVIKVCKIFKDDLTLDNLSRPQLVGMCRYMNLNTFGTDGILRYHVRHRMRQIKLDDKAISYEGVESLSVPELQTACMTRGLRTHGMSPGRLRDDLTVWLDLRLKYGVPSTLLVLANAYVYASGEQKTEFSTQIGALQSVLASVPEELFHEIELEVHNAEGAATNRQRLEVLKEQQELIDEEGAQNEGNEQEGRETPKDDENIDEAEGEQAVKEAEASIKEGKETKA